MVSRSGGLADFYRCEFDSPTSTPESNDSIDNSGWLRSAGTYLVSHFVLLCWIVVYSLNLEPSTLSSLSNESIQTLCELDGWP